MKAERTRLPDELRRIAQEMDDTSQFAVRFAHSGPDAALLREAARELEDSEAGFVRFRTADLPTRKPTIPYWPDLPDEGEGP